MAKKPKTIKLNAEQSRYLKGYALQLEMAKTANQQALLQVARECKVNETHSWELDAMFAKWVDKGKRPPVETPKVT